MTTTDTETPPWTEQDEKHLADLQRLVDPAPATLEAIRRLKARKRPHLMQRIVDIRRGRAS